jgi:hypothetical protein
VKCLHCLFPASDFPHGATLELNPLREFSTRYESRAMTATQARSATLLRNAGLRVRHCDGASFEPRIFEQTTAHGYIRLPSGNPRDCNSVAGSKRNRVLAAANVPAGRSFATRFSRTVISLNSGSAASGAGLCACAGKQQLQRTSTAENFAST